MQTEERQARIFEKGLKPNMRRFVTSHIYLTMRQVIDAAIAQTRESVVTQKRKEAASCSVQLEKGKEKRPLSAVGQAPA